MKKRTILTYAIFVTPWVVVCFVLIKVTPAFVIGQTWQERLDLLERSFETVLPFQIFTATYVAIAVFTVGYLVTVWSVGFSKKDYRPGAEYGDASWGNIAAINRVIAAKNLRENILLSKNL